MGEWQPIETAPKDGREILVWWKSDYGGSGLAVIFYELTLSAWVESTYCDIDMDGHPTHWQPLPEPPK